MKAKPAVYEQTPAEKRERQEAIQRERKLMWRWTDCRHMKEWFGIVRAFLESCRAKQYADDAFCEVNACMIAIADDLLGKGLSLDPTIFVELIDGLTPSRCRAALQTYNAMAIRIQREVTRDYSKEEFGRSILPPVYPTTANEELVATDTPVTLIEFMKIFCTPLSKNLLDSRVKALQSAARRKVIKLPKHEGKWKRGQSKKYRPTALVKNWPKYRDELPDLPELCLS